MAGLLEFVEDAIRELDGGKTFFDPESFPWVRRVESRWTRIRHELDSLMSVVDLLPGFEEIQVEQCDLTTDKRWKIFPLFAYGHWVGRNRFRCPETVNALHEIDGLQAAMFSILQPGKILEPHRGPYSGVLRYHLGLRIPKPESQCGIRVGEDTRNWYEGKSLVFDDSHMHNAWNHSDRDRVVLFVDFARPLPAQISMLNDSVIDEISKSDFIRGAVKKWQEWEGIHGIRLDALLSKTRDGDEYGTI